MKYKEKNTKSCEVKIRITSQGKELLESIAAKQKMSLSAYIRDTCLSASNTNLIAWDVEIDNIFNELYHQFTKQGNTEAAGFIKTFHKKYRRN